jgi:hypothetical protein
VKTNARPRPLGNDLVTVGRNRHGLTPVEFQMVLDHQGGRCAICRTADPGPNGWVIDHDHEVARTHPHPVGRGCRSCVRGITCNGCNSVLGYGRDDPDLLRTAAAYLEHNAGRMGRG